MDWAVKPLLVVNTLLFLAIVYGIVRQHRGAGAARLEERDRWVTTVEEARIARDEAMLLAKLHEEDAGRLFDGINTLRSHGPGARVAAEATAAHLEVHDKARKIREQADKHRRNAARRPEPKA